MQAKRGILFVKILLKGAFAMQITANFPTIDDAENCARRLKHSCPGIRSIRIRFRTPVSREEEPVPAVIPAVVPDGTPNGMNSSIEPNGAPYAAFALAPEGPEKAAGEAKEREDSTMLIEVDPFYRHEAEAILLNEHAGRIRIGD